jgi:hypothetical protein
LPVGDDGVTGDEGCVEARRANDNIARIRLAIFCCTP